MFYFMYENTIKIYSWIQRLIFSSYLSKKSKKGNHSFAIATLRKTGAMDLINSTVQLKYDNMETIIEKLRRNIKNNIKAFKLFRQKRIAVKHLADQIMDKIKKCDLLITDPTFEELDEKWNYYINQYHSAAKFGSLLLKENARLFAKIRMLKKIVTKRKKSK